MISEIGLLLTGLASMVGLAEESPGDLKISTLSDDGVWRIVELGSHDVLEEVGSMMDLDLFAWEPALRRGAKILVASKRNGKVSQSIVARVSGGKIDVAFGPGSQLPDEEALQSLKSVLKKIEA